MVSGVYYAHIGWFLNDARHDSVETTNPVIRDFKGVPEIAIPAEVVVLERVPMLGTGKVDQVSVVKLAHERAAGQAPAAA